MERYLETLGDFTNKSLERELADKEIGRPLVLTNFTKCHSSWPEAMELLDTTSGGLKTD